jgi:hypothetical protein
VQSSKNDFSKKKNDSPPGVAFEYKRVRNWVTDVAVRDILQYEWLTDDVIRLDVAAMGGSDKDFFPFDELLENLVLTFSRDQTATSDCAVRTQKPFKEDATGTESVVRKTNKQFKEIRKKKSSLS